MPTLRQKKLAKSIVENLQASKPLNKKELLVSAGYDETTAMATPNREIEAKGTQQELRKLGFDPDTARQIVGEILVGGENDNVKLKAADMIFKVHGEYAPEKHLNVNVEVENSDRIKQATVLLNEIHRTGSVGGDGGTASALDTQAQD